MNDPITFILTLSSLLTMLIAAGFCLALLNQNRRSGWVMVLLAAHGLMLTRRVYLVWMQLLYNQPTDRINELTSTLVGFCFVTSWFLLYRHLSSLAGGGSSSIADDLWPSDRWNPLSRWRRSVPGRSDGMAKGTAETGIGAIGGTIDGAAGGGTGGGGGIGRYAVILNVLALSLTLGIGGYAFLVSHQTVRDRFYQSHQMLSDRMAQELDRCPIMATQSRQAILDHLTTIWSQASSPSHAAGLFVIGSDGRVWLSPNQPEYQGQDISAMRLDPPAGSVATLSQLIQQKGRWTGQLQSDAGPGTPKEKKSEGQKRGKERGVDSGGFSGEGAEGRGIEKGAGVLALTYSHRLHALVGVHLPVQVLRQELWETIFPWFSGFLLVGLLLFPYAGLLMYRAYQATHRQLVQTNRTLSASESRFRELIDHIDEVFWIIDPAKRQVIYISPAFQRIMDYVPGPGPRMIEHILPRLHPADRDAAKATIDAWCQPEAGQYPALEVRAMRPDGTIRWTRTIVYPVKDEQDKVRHLIGMTRDITQRRRTEEALRESESRFRQLADHLEDVFWLLDLIGPRLAYVSPAVQAMFGHSPVQFMRQPRTFLEMVHRDDRAMFLRRGRLHHPMKKPVEFRIVRSDGTIRWLRSRAFPVRDEAGRTYRLAGITQDITAWKINQQALQEQTQRNGLMIQTAMDGFCVLDEQVRILEVNPAFCQMLGYSQRELLSMSISDLDVDYDTPEIQRQKQLAYEQGRARFETRYRHHDGHWLTVEISVRRVIVSQKLQLFVFVGDVSAYKLAQEHYRQAAESNRRLLNEVNHRVRNNLASLLSLISLTQGKTQDARQFAAAIEHRIGAMAQVHNLLVDSGWSDLDLSQMIADMASWMQASVTHQVPVTIDGPPLMVNPRQAMPLAMTFQELFTNSMKYGAHRQPGGQVHISWQVEPLADGRRNVTLGWLEQGGPAIAQTNRPSLGSELIRGFVQFELGGHCQLSFPPSGADHRFTFVLEPTDQSSSLISTSRSAALEA